MGDLIAVKETFIAFGSFLFYVIDEKDIFQRVCGRHHKIKKDFYFTPLTARYNLVYIFEKHETCL